MKKYVKEKLTQFLEFLACNGTPDATKPVEVKEEVKSSKSVGRKAEKSTTKDLPIKDLKGIVKPKISPVRKPKK